MRRAAGLTVAAVLLIPTGAASAQEPSASPNAPNVVVVMTDDERYDDMATMPDKNPLEP